MEFTTKISKASAKSSLGRDLRPSTLRFLGSNILVLDDSSPNTGYFALIKLDSVDSLRFVKKARQSIRMSWAINIVGDALVRYDKSIALQPSVLVSIEPIFRVSRPFLHL